jgi:hypothetical protein
MIILTANAVMTMVTDIPTLLEHLESHLRRPEVEAQVAPLFIRIAEALDPFFGICLMTGMVIQRAAESPPSPGYEQWLVERGWDPVIARLSAQLVIRRGKRIAKERSRLSGAASAIRFLARPGRSRKAVRRRIKVLLAAWEETSVFDTIFGGTDLSDFEFVRALESAAKGEAAAFERLAEIAALLVPHLSVTRGPRVSEASATHEAFMDFVVSQVEPSAYTWDDVGEKFSDDVTEATRREFDDPDFDPRPARRRFVAGQKRNQS